MTASNIAFVFPGQGSQQIGMGRAMAEAHRTARDVLEEIDDALSQKLSTILFEGPEDALTRTENTQPALFATSMMIVETLRREAGLDLSRKIGMVAGHSLGEYTACAAASVLPLAQTAQLLRLRGQAMQAAVPVGEGAMAAVLGLEIDQVREIAAAAAGTDICQVANDNAPGQIVISGHIAAIERASLLAKEKGAKRVVMLPVSAPFHCRLMAPAADVMADALGKVDFAPPIVPVMANVLAASQIEPARIRQALIDQVTGSVRWRECVLAMKMAGIEKIYEIGTGQVLAGLVKRIDKDIQVRAINNPEDIDALVKEIA